MLARSRLGPLRGARALTALLVQFCLELPAVCAVFSLVPGLARVGQPSRFKEDELRELERTLSALGFR
jgi:hypothetical protein